MKGLNSLGGLLVSISIACSPAMETEKKHGCQDFDTIYKDLKTAKDPGSKKWFKRKLEMTENAIERCPQSPDVNLLRQIWIHTRRQLQKNYNPPKTGPIPPFNKKKYQLS